MQTIYVMNSSVAASSQLLKSLPTSITAFMSMAKELGCQTTFILITNSHDKRKYIIFSYIFFSFWIKILSKAFFLKK